MHRAGSRHLAATAALCVAASTVFAHVQCNGTLEVCVWSDGTGITLHTLHTLQLGCINIGLQVNLAIDPKAKWVDANRLSSSGSKA